MTDHASDEYLTGLSDLDRARAIVAVRWCGCEWTYTFPNRSGVRYRSLARQTVRLRPATAETPINGNWCAYQPAKKRWGLGWTGTASLMELAESQGWRLESMGDFTGGRCVVLIKRHGDNITDETVAEGSDTYRLGTDGRPYTPTIHAAVLLACAAAAMREDNDATR